MPLESAEELSTESKSLREYRSAPIRSKIDPVGADARTLRLFPPCQLRPSSCSSEPSVSRQHRSITVAIDPGW